MASSLMKCEDVIATLRANERVLRERGVLHAALFGSRARGDDNPASDIDIIIDIDPAAEVTLFDYVGLKSYIAELFTIPVDVVDREALRPYVRPQAEADAVYAF